MGLDIIGRLIRALEIYISEFVNNTIVSEFSSDIVEFRPDHVLSFNYSNTFERVYGIGKRITYDYIHGKAVVKRDVISNNLVLGIDEYLVGDIKDKEVDFIAFKKYYQRIYKKTGNEYRNWIDEIKDNKTEKNLRNQFSLQIPINKYTSDERHNLCIFGHSLDITDKDVLRDFILNDNVYTTIYYYSKDGEDMSNLGEKITNLVKIIGQDELIRRTGGNTKTIEFKMQKDMIK